MFRVNSLLQIRRVRILKAVLGALLSTETGGQGHIGTVSGEQTEEDRLTQPGAFPAPLLFFCPS